MQPLRLAIATAPFRQPLRESLVTAAACGGTGVQWDARHEIRLAEYGETARRQLLHEMQEHGLKVASLSFPLRRPLHDPEQLDRRVAALRETMEQAARFQAKVVTVRIGRVSDDPAAADRMRLADVLRDLARFSNHTGVVLALTPAGEDAASLVELIGNVKEGPLGVDFDPAAVVLSRRSAAADLRTLHTLAMHFQVRDAISDLDGGGSEVPVGRGEVDWPEMLAMIGEMNYRGWLTIRRTLGDDIPGDCARAVQYVHNVATGL